MNLQTILDNNEAVKEWLAKHRKFEVLDIMAAEMRASNTKFCFMPLYTDTQWAMAHYFIRPNGDIALGLILCDRESMPMLEFISCCMAGAADCGAIIEPRITYSRRNN